DLSDAQGALRCDRACLNTARSVGDDPLMSAQLTRISIDRIAVRQLERTLAQCWPVEAELVAIQSMLEEEAEAPRMLWAMRGERAGWVVYAEAAHRGEVSLAELPGVGPPTTLERFLQNPERVKFRRYTADLLRAHTEAVEIVRLPPEQWKARFALLKARF